MYKTGNRSRQSKYCQQKLEENVDRAELHKINAHNYAKQYADNMQVMSALPSDIVCESNRFFFVKKKINVKC